MTTENSLNVTHFQRKAGAGHYSVERLFEDVRCAMPADIGVTLRINRFPSQGVLRRIYDAIYARRDSNQVNHVLGDVHYLAWFLPKERTVLTVLDCVSLERLAGIRRWLMWVLWYWWPLKRAGRVTVISKFSRDSLLRWVRYPRDLIDVIPPTLSVEFRKDPRPLNFDCPRLLQIGTAPNKNLARVIEAIQGLRVRLVIVGAVDEGTRARLAAFNISYEEHVNLSDQDLIEQYRRADLLVFASTYEGFGMPIIEAQAVGRPVVAGNVCSMPEAAGGAACLIDPFDVGSIRNGILRLLEDAEYTKQLIEAGFRNAQRYSPERIAAAYAEVYRKLRKSN